MSVLVGRNAPRALIDRCVDEASAGQGRLLLITGEAGIGKSTLAEEALERATAAGFRTARTHAVDDPGAPSLWPWLRLGRSLPEIRQLLGPSLAEQNTAAQRFGVFDAVTEHLVAAAADSGLAVVLEDLHWADALSLALLRHVVADLGGARLLLIGTARHSGGSAWDGQLAALHRGAGTRVAELEGLSTEEVRDWLGRSPDRRDWLPALDRLIQSTRGNPFYISLLTSAVPSAIRSDAARRDIVAEVNGRLRTLPADARRLVEIAAVAGDSASVALLADVSAATEAVVADRLAAARDIEILHGSADVVFGHALVRDAVVAGLSSIRRDDLHRVIADALAGRDDPDEYGSIAEHWRAADGADAAVNFVTWSQRAASVAARRFDPERAVGYLRSALGRAERLGLPADRQAELAVELGTAEFYSGDLVGAVETCRLAADLAVQAGRPELVADAALVVHGVGAWDAARTVIALCERALQLLPEADARRRALLLARLSAALTETVDPSRGAALSLEALRAAEAVGDPAAELEAIAARHLAITVPQSVDERERLARRAIELGATGDPSPVSRIWGHLWLLMALHQRGDLDGAHEQAEAVRRLAEREHSPIARWHHHRILAAGAALTGDFTAAARHSDDALRLAQRIGDDSMVGIHHAFTLFVAIIRGDPTAIDPGMIAAFRAGPRMPLLRALLVIALIVRGDRDEAADLFEELRGLPDEYATGVRWAGTVGQIGYAAALLGDREVAERAYRLLRPTAGWYDGDGSGFIVATGSMARPVADVALAAGRTDEAVELYADAVIANTRIGARPYVALSRLGWAGALLARRRDPALRSTPADLAAATSLAGQAAAEFRRLDMPGPAERADRLLGELAAAVRSDSPLTARENDVVVLLAKGRRNKEIAADLFLSERTVESHVRNILVKLDLSSRAEVVGWLEARRSHPPSGS